MAEMITDNRTALAMTEADADAMFQRIAEQTILMIRTAAEYEARIGALKADAEHEIGLCKAILAPLKSRLGDYIDNHKDQFAKKRSKVTPWGSYGLRKVSSLEITDEEALWTSVRAQNIPGAIVTTEKISKDAVTEALKQGKKISGAQFIEGERAGYTVKKELLENAKMSAKIKR